MACLREQTPDGRFGTLSCDEEGCLFRCIKNPSNSEIVALSPETDCVLQLQLRAGHSEDAGGLLIIGSTTAHNPRFRNLSLDREPNAFGYGFREHLWRCSHCDTLHREWTQSDHICPVCGTANNIEQRRLDVQPEPEVGDDRDAGDGSKFLFPKSVLRAADRAAMGETDRYIQNRKLYLDGTLGLPPESGGDEGEYGRLVRRFEELRRLGPKLSGNQRSEQIAIETRLDEIESERGWDEMGTSDGDSDGSSERSVENTPNGFNLDSLTARDLFALFRWFVELDYATQQTLIWQLFELSGLEQPPTGE